MNENPRFFKGSAEQTIDKNNCPKMPALSAENKIGYGCNFFCEENFNSQGSFSVFFYACGKKMANYANFAFPLPFRHFLLNFLCVYIVEKSAGCGGFSHFQKELSPDCHGKTRMERRGMRTCSKSGSRTGGIRSFFILRFSIE